MEGTARSINAIFLAFILIKDLEKKKLVMH
jgi:hypothetical protein